MPKLSELEVVRDVLYRRLLGQAITAAEGIMPGAAIVIRDLTGAGFSPALAGARFAGIGDAYADEILWWARLHPTASAPA